MTSRPIPPPPISTSVPSSPPRARTPERPPHSPLSPRSTFRELAIYTVNREAQQRQQGPPPRPSEFITQPDSVSVPEEESTDALALKAAISILQIQRDKAKKDVLKWEKIRKEAKRDPAAFVEEVQRQGAERRTQKDGYLAPTLENLNGQEDSEDGAEQTAGEGGGDAIISGMEGETAPRFPKLPEMQNVFRCPPVNWAKYHVMGESLDKLHAEQQRRPHPGEPQLDPGQVNAVPAQLDHLGRAQEHVLAAPYSMFDDRLEAGPRDHKNG
ncbi:MAG: hypothetical protein M1820_003375 [Bogoriella megaspora]|nr:MAG: hypothetical protein M1820_003375 [Bogoriella megaspora]